MILKCSFEELTSLTSGAEHVLERWSAGGRVAAPPEMVAQIESLLQRLDGDLTVETLSDQQRLERTTSYLLDFLRERMDALVLEQYVGAEDAVHAYFEYANVLAFLDRLRALGREMELLIEVMTGEPPTPETAATVSFPD